MASHNSTFNIDIDLLKIEIHRSVNPCHKYCLELLFLVPMSTCHSNYLLLVDIIVGLIKKVNTLTLIQGITNKE